MMLEIPQVLDAPTLAAVRALADERELFAAGSTTAGWRAVDRKNNLQARQEGLVLGIQRKIEQAVMDHPVVQAAARPRDLVQLLLSRYDEGMFYGSHVDNALMAGRRTDISFTLFISAPEDYAGGELVVEETGGERAVKLPAGSLFLYPSGDLHRVETVTRGSRLVAVGWLRSFVRRPDRRQILFDLDQAIHHLREGQGSSGESLDLLLKMRSNLMRMWYED